LRAGLVRLDRQRDGRLWLDNSRHHKNQTDKRIILVEFIFFTKKLRFTAIAAEKTSGCSSA
jgi:hypothetical protein